MRLLYLKSVHTNNGGCKNLFHRVCTNCEMECLEALSKKRCLNDIGRRDERNGKDRSTLTTNQVSESNNETPDQGSRCCSRRSSMRSVRSGFQTVPHLHVQIHPPRTQRPWMWTPLRAKVVLHRDPVAGRWLLPLPNYYQDPHQYAWMLL